jgi:hypothetical protein
MKTCWSRQWPSTRREEKGHKLQSMGNTNGWLHKGLISSFPSSAERIPILGLRGVPSITSSRPIYRQRPSMSKDGCILRDSFDL